MIDFALEAERKEGKAPLDASTKACLLRFRPHDDHQWPRCLEVAARPGTGWALASPTIGHHHTSRLILEQILNPLYDACRLLAFDWIAHSLPISHRQSRSKTPHLETSA